MSNRQTVFFLPVDPRDKSHKDPDVIDFSVPRHAQLLEIKCILHAVVNSLCGLGSCLSCGTCTALVCCTDTLRIQAIRLKSEILDLRLSGKQIICLCHEVIHDRASGVLRVV